SDVIQAQSGNTNDHGCRKVFTFQLALAAKYEVGTARQSWERPPRPEVAVAITLYDYGALIWLPFSTAELPSTRTRTPATCHRLSLSSPEQSFFPQKAQWPAPRTVAPTDSLPSLALPTSPETDSTPDARSPFQLHADDIRAPQRIPSCPTHLRRPKLVILSAPGRIPPTSHPPSPETPAASLPGNTAAVPCIQTCRPPPVPQRKTH